VTEGQTLDLELLHQPDGTTIDIDRVLLIENDGRVTTGKPFIEGAKVVAEVLERVKGEKLIVFRYKRKTRYHVKTGHRQQYNRVQVKSIVTA